MVGTIWTELDETKLYHTINLVEIDKLFSAYQKNVLLVSNNSTLIKNLSKRHMKNEKSDIYIKKDVDRNSLEYSSF